MKKLILIFILISVNLAAASTKCRFKIDGYALFEEEMNSSILCFSEIRSLIKSVLYQNKNLCLNSDENSKVEFSWSFGKEKGLSHDSLSCVGLEEEYAAELVRKFSSVTKILERPEEIKLEPLKNTECIKEEDLDRVSVNHSESLEAKKIDLTFKNENELKKAIQSFVPGQLFDRPMEGWQVILNLPNDNKGLGIFDSLFGRPGNDEGNTHGLLVSVSKDISGDYHLTMEYMTNLYTSRTGTFTENKDGTFNVDQHFLEDNLAKIIIDNKDKKDAKYYKVGVGWHTLNENKLGNLLLSSGKQQKEWHSMLGRDNAPQYNYLSGNGNREGLYLELGAGLEKEVYRGENFRVKSEIEGGINYSGAESKASHLSSSASISLDYQRSPTSYAYRIALGASHRKFNNSSSDESKTRITFEMGKDTFSCGASLVKNWYETGPEYVKYDLDSDKLMDIYCRKNF